MNNSIKKLSKFIEQYASVIYGSGVKINFNDDTGCIEMYQTSSERNILSYNYNMNHDVELIQGNYLEIDPVRRVDILDSFLFTNTAKSKSETVIRMFRQLCSLYSANWVVASTPYVVVGEYLSGKSPGSVVDLSQSTDYMRIVLCPESQQVFAEILDAEKEHIGTFLLSNIEE